MSAHAEVGLRRVRVLDVDPDLAARLGEEERRRAWGACWAALATIPAGVWTPPALLSDPSAIYALVVVDGMLCRETSLGSCSLTELLARGDVFPPPTSHSRDADGYDPGRIDTPVALTALARSQVMVLTTSFLKAGGLWPGLVLAVQDRVAAQREHLAAQSLVLHLPRAVERVLLTLWLLAERCGRVTARGTALPFQVSHTALGRMIGAQRPTVSLAVAALRDNGSLEMTADGRIVLTPQVRREVLEMTSVPPGEDPTPVGASLRLSSRELAGDRG